MNAEEIHLIRKDFPELNARVRDKPLCYLDNAATTLKPVSVLHAMEDLYRNYYANIHRGAYLFSHTSTERFDGAREKCRKFIGAAKATEVLFTKGATEGINIVASGYGRKFIQEGDEILLSAMEHHSNIVPWQILCREKNARLTVIPITDSGEIDFEDFKKSITAKTKILALAHVSNVLGTVNPVKEMIAYAKERGIVTLIDGAQAVPHIKVDVQELGCDFYVFSGHKLYGPTGIGILYGREGLLKSMDPYQSGGDMILSVTFEKTIYAPLPQKFEAGTPNIAGAVGLGAAIDYVESLGMERIAAYEAELLAHATARLKEIPGLRFIGTARDKASVLSFTLDCAHPHDIATILDTEGIAVRTGHHCAQPVMDRFRVPATARASFAFYNTKEEIETLFNGLLKVRKIMG